MIIIVGHAPSADGYKEKLEISKAMNDVPSLKRCTFMKRYYSIQVFFIISEQLTELGKYLHYFENERGCHYVDNRV